MHRLVQGQHKEALPVRSELSLPSLGRRLGRLVEIGLGQRLQNVQVPFTQLKILLSNLSEGWIGAGIGVGNVVAASLISSITLSTTPFEMLSANLIASFMCIVCSP
jgi:hypothetical protein